MDGEEDAEGEGQRTDDGSHRAAEDRRELVDQRPPRGGQRDHPAGLMQLVVGVRPAPQVGRHQDDGGAQPFCLNTSVLYSIPSAWKPYNTPMPFGDLAKS